MDPGMLLAMMEQFSPQRQQQEQLQLQALAQQLAQGAAQEQRAQEQFLASQAQAQQLNPIEVQLRQAALAQIPQQQEAAQLAAEAARFGLGQQQAMAPLAQQQAAAQIAATQAGPQHQAASLDLQRQQLAQTGSHYTALERAQDEENQLSRMGMALNALSPQHRVPGVELNQAGLGEAFGGLLRPSGNPAALNQFAAAGNPAAAQQYLAANPEVRDMAGVDPKVLELLATGAVGGGAAAVAPGAIPMAPPPEPVSPWTWLAGPPGYGVGKLANWMGHNRGFTEYERQRRTVK